jgi:hypothetical protein
MPHQEEAVAIVVAIHKSHSHREEAVEDSAQAALVDLEQDSVQAAGAEEMADSEVDLDQEAEEEEVSKN